MVTSSGNTPKASNRPLLSSTGVNPSTSASGSKPSSNTKNDRISRTPSSNEMNKVEVQSRKVKSSLNKRNSESKNVCIKHVKHPVKGAKVIQIVLWYLDSGCSKHMTGDRSQLTNFVHKFLGTVKFGNDKVAKIIGYGDYQIRNITISRIYYVEGLGHNLFLVGSQGTNLYSLSIGDMMASSPICLLSKAIKTKSWLWHRRLSHLNFGAINHLARPTGPCYGVASIDGEKKYAPKKKAYHIYNRCTRKIIETINVDFDELTAMASEQLDLRPGLQCMTPAIPSSGLVPNPPPSASFIPPSRHEWDLVFQLEFDKFFFPPASVASLVPVEEVLAPVESNGSPSSTTVDKDTPLPSTSQTTPQSQSQIIPLSAEEESHHLEVVHMSNNPYFGIPIPETVSKESPSSDVIPTTVHSDALISKHLSKWTKDHPLQNIIGDPSRPVSIRLQLHEQALFCYHDAFLNSVEPKTYKDALLNKVMVITLKWIYKVKLDELGGILKNKARLVARRYRQEEGIDFAEFFALVDRLKAVQIFFAFTSHMNMIVFQIDVKTAFLNGLQISQSPRGIFLNQSKYALESLKKYGMESCDPVDTPMVEKSKLDEDTQGKAVDPTHYHGMVGTLMYLTSSRPDLVYSVVICARYQARPTKKHLHAVKRIFQYLRGTVNRGLWYSKDYAIALTAFADADHAGCQDTRRSTSGSMQLLGDRLVSWSSKRQKSAAISSTKA
ncbi:retrovirus-related pol polyprotein from transposon TNT 1-94, partial [Tanacetum coccineum]